MVTAHAPESGNSGKSDGSNLILLKNAHINTDNAIATMKAQSSSDDHGGEYYLIQFDGHVTAEYKKAVEANGAILHGYIPNNAYLAKINDCDYANVSRLSFVKWIGPYLPDYKIAPSLHSKTGLVEIIIISFEPNNNSDILSQIETNYGQIVNHNGKYIRAIVDSSCITDIAAIENVEWIDEYLKPVILNDQATAIMNVNVTTVRETHGLDGTGQIIGIADTGLDTGVNDSSMHDDLEGRIYRIYDYVDENPEDYDGHGTHVAGSALGNGSHSNGKYSGTAPNSTLVFQAIGNETSGYLEINNLSELFLQAYNDGSRIHSNSWGLSSEHYYGVYEYLAIDVDNFMWNHPDMLILFSAGNEGPSNNTIAPPSTAKNCLTVGASENFRPEKSDADDPDDIAYFSSRGPTVDRRIKPDVVAPGTWIISTRSSINKSTYSWGTIDDYYAYSSGTSMATPLTAGTAALVRQYYVKNESINPSAALIKATLINGAVNTGNHINDQGWGRVDLKNSLFIDEPASILYFDNISLNDTEIWYTKQYISSGHPLKMSLVWTDYPAEEAADPALYNDLDLKVIGPSSTYLGNGGSEPDRRNNVEQVSLESPESGWYNISVNGTNIQTEEPQPFALVISGALDIDPPLSVIDLNETARGYSWINWTWNHTNPDDLNHTIIYIDGTFNGNTSNYYYNATGFDPGETHNISILAVDRAGNINQTWVNDSAATLTDNDKPVIHSVTNSVPFAGREMNVSVNVTDNHRVNIVMANNNVLNYTGNNLWNATIIAGAGNQPLNISATDVAGNVNWSNSSYLGLILPNANFTSNVTSGNKPLAVKFWDNSTNATYLSWDFDEDGIEDSNESAPIWIFTEVGNYSVILNATNENGSDIYIGYIVVTTPTTTTKKSSSGSGGGGGGGTTGEDYENILFKDFAIQYLKKGTPATYEFKGKGNAIQSIQLTSNRNAGQIKIIIEVLKNTSTIAGEKPEGDVYSNMNIWAGNAAFKDSIENAVITFRVSKDWLTKHGVHAEDVVMAMYTNDRWTILDSPSIISDDGEYVTYEVKTKKLASPFAITSISEEKHIPVVNKLSENLKVDINKTQSGENLEGEEEAEEKLSTIGILACTLSLTGAYLILKRQ
ncbi:S8 family serine peptidase [Methanohalophilus sp.]|uniref:S8 family serine peptidase n=1 Tax=Methanohalophilus sp. TaxID=1966352 RepID=UPI0026238C41|nr:S8 family serine peptidase [Methanohalophilus sp.]